jgi:phosphoribosyl 1,2-cyclic phosphate phosphodiesterase
VFGYRFEEFVYLTDVKSVDNDEIEKIKGAKVLVVNALRTEPHHSHFNLEEALEFSSKVGAQQTYFTHISHLLGFHEEVEKKLPKNVFLAYDNLQLKI